jgi:hypothetical protein
MCGLQSFKDRWTGKTKREKIVTGWMHYIQTEQVILTPEIPASASIRKSVFEEY